MAVFDAGTIEAILRLRDDFTGVAKRVATQAQTLGDRIDRSGAAMSRAGSALAPLSLGVAALGVGALKAAIDFESSFAGVIKTVDDATDSMGRLTPVGEALKQSFRDLALEIPISANELAGIGEVAGQLGIETQNIAGFTETMAKLGVTTNLSAEEAATSLARLANVTGLPQTEFERLGSTVVALGNNLATTESEIVMFGQRIAGAGAIAGLSEPQILAIGGAMSSVGIEAEAGGTAVQKVLLTMNDAVAAGGAELVRFADLSGQSVEQFAAGWRDNAGAQFTAFVEGLAAQGDQASAVLKDLIGTDQRLQRAFLSLAQSGDTLRNAMSLANVAWVENTALAKEAEIRFQTTSAELTILWNNVKDVAISLGDALLPTLKDAVGFLQESVVPVLRDAAKWFEDLSPASKRLAAGFAALIVVATPVLFTLSTMAPLLSVIARGFAAIVPRAAAASAAVGASGAAAAASVGPMVAAKIAARNMWRAISGPVGIAVAVITAAVGAFKLLKRHIDEGSTAAANFARSQASVDSMTAAIAKLESEGKKVSQRLRDVLTDAEQTRDRMKEMAGSVDETSESFTAMRDELKALAAKDMAAWANASEEAKKRAEDLAAALPQSERVIEDLTRSVRLLQSESELTPSVLRNIAKQALALGIAVEDLPPELKNIVVSFDNVTRAGRDATEEEARLERETTRLKESIQELVDQFQGRGLIASAEQAAEAVRHVGGVSKLTADDHDQLRETVDGAIDAYQRMEQAVPPVVRGLADQLNALHDVRDAARESAEAMEALRQAEDALLVTAPTLTLSWDEMLSVGQKLGPEIHGMTMGTIEAIPPTMGLADAFAHLKTEAPEALAKTQGFFAGVAQGFQDLWKGISGGQGISGLLKNVGSGLSEGLGQILSGGIASAVNVAVGLAWTGLKKLGGFFKSLFGGASEAELAGRETAGAFRDGVIATLNDGQLAEASQAAMGAWRGNDRGAQFLIGVRDAYLAVGKSAEEAQAAVTRLWKAEARGPEAVAAVQRELQVVLDQANALAEAEREITARNREIADGLLGIVDAGQAAFDPAQLEPYLAQMQELGLMTAEEAAALRELADDAHTDWQAMEEAARTYGVAMKTVVDEAGNETQVLDESLLGLGHAQAKLTDEAGRLAAAWDLLAGEGAHTGAAIRGMTDEAQAFVTQALEMGIALPAAMQPMIEKMIEQERLTDQNGKKLTDLSQVPFAAPLTSGFDLLADKIQMLIIALGGPSGLSKAVEEMVTSAGLNITDLSGEWAAMATDMKAQFGSFEAFVEFRTMTARAGVSFDTMQSRWATMTDKQQQRYGTFEAYVRDEVLRKMARDAGLAWKTMRTDWDAMTDAQEQRYGTFEAYVQEKVLRKMAREAGLKWKDMRADWKALTEDQQAQYGSFADFVQSKLDAIEQRDEVTTSIGVTYDDPGFAVDDQEMTVRVRYDDPGWTPPRGAVSAQHGTPFRQFGGGTPAMLHGLERVMTAQEGRGIAAVIGNIQRSLGAIADLSGVAALAQRIAPVAAMAAGGMGTVTAPTLFLAGEAGPEQFAFSGADRRFGNETRDGRREASDLGALRQELADLKRIMERGQDELPFRISRAIRDAMAETV